MQILYLADLFMYLRAKFYLLWNCIWNIKKFWSISKKKKKSATVAMLQLCYSYTMNLYNY